jgi:hypothetical protein
VLLGLTGFLIFGLLGLIDQGSQLIWWLLAATSLAGLMGGVTE